MTVVDPNALKILATIPVAKKVQRIALFVDDRREFTATQRQPRLAVIDAATNDVSTWVALPTTACGNAATPDGKWLVVVFPRTNQAGIVDLQTLKMVRQFDVPKPPQEVLVPPDGAVAYVSRTASRKIAVIDLKDWKVEKLITAGLGADGLAWAAAEKL